MIKRLRGRCWLGLSRQVVSVRPYPGLASLWQMVARSAYTQLNYSPALLAATIIGLLFLYVLPPAGAVIGLAVLLSGGAGPQDAGPAALAVGTGLTGWALMSLSYLPMLRLYRLSPLRAPEPAADRPAVRRHDGRLRPAAPHWPRRGMARAHQPDASARAGQRG